MSAADVCRRERWVVGDVLVKSLCMAYEVRFIGEKVVAKRVGRLSGKGRWEPDERAEYFEAFDEPDQWAKATPEQLAALRPPADPAVTTYGLVKAYAEVFEFLPEFDGDKPREGAFRRDPSGRLLKLNGCPLGRPKTSLPVRRLTIPEVCERLLGPGYSVVAHEGGGSWVRGDTWTGNGSAFRLTPRVARGMLGEVAAWLAAHESDPEPACIWTITV